MRTCRLCGSEAMLSVLDLGASPPCESFLTKEQLDQPEVTYPLHLRLCQACLLLQIPALITPEETFGGDYAYFSSCSTSWVEHARRFVDHAITRVGLTRDDLVVEVAANDGYLLQHVVAAGIRCLGIEPSANCSQAARAKGIPMLRAFLDEQVAARVRAAHGPARLVVANNVYAHILDIVGFTRGLAGLVDRDGWVSIEVHHALELVTKAQFDTIYHEHFQYWSVLAARRGLASGGLRLVDVELLPSHGGSIRLWAVREDSEQQELPGVAEVEAMERDAGLGRAEGYLGLGGRVARIRDDLVAHLIEARRQGRRAVAYGMPGKGNTLLNYCGIRPDLLAYGADMNTFKHGRYAPGSRIPVVSPEHLVADAPDDVVVLPWNLRKEITAQLTATLRPGTRLIFPLPHLEVEEVAPR